MRRLAPLFIVLLLSGCTSDPVLQDSDGDGYSDEAEIAAGTDPNNATSLPEPVVEPLENETAVPAWGDLATATIRPGASVGGYCTYNFLYYGQNGSAYIGTAGHCTDDIGERVSVGDGPEIGTVVYDSDLIGHGSDFSLILLDDDAVASAHPQMLGWNGPTGIIEARELSEGDIIQVYGYGMFVGDNEESRARQGALVAWTEEEYDIDIPAVNGDSGASLLHESGKAFGIISRYGIDGQVPSTDTGPLMAYVFAGLEQAGYGDVMLATIE